MGWPSRAPGPLLAVFTLLSCASLASALSPPWWVHYNLYREALHRDPCLNISSLHQEPAQPSSQAAFIFNITLTCANASADKAPGLATLATVKFDFGGTLLISRVIDTSGHPVRPLRPRSAAHALRLAGAALEGNPWFVRTAVSSPLPCFEFYWVVCTPSVAQVWADNLADLWGNLNLLAAELFARCADRWVHLNLLAAELFASVLGLDRFGIRTTTMQFQPRWPMPAPGSQEQRDGDSQQQAQVRARAAGLEVEACAPGQACYRVRGSAPEHQQEQQVGSPQQQAGFPQQQAAASVAATVAAAASYEPKPDRQARWEVQPQRLNGEADEVEEAALQLSAVEQLWRRDQQQQLAAVLGAGSSSRRQLAAAAGGDDAWLHAWSAGKGKGAEDLPWGVAAKCWALGIARWAGGDRGVLLASRWLV